PDVPARGAATVGPTGTDPVLVPRGNGDGDLPRGGAVASAGVAVTVAGEESWRGPAAGRSDAGADPAGHRLRGRVPCVRLPGTPLRSRDRAPDSRPDARPGWIPGRVPRGAGHQRRVVRDRLPPLSRLARLHPRAGRRANHGWQTTVSSAAVRRPL